MKIQGAGQRSSDLRRMVSNSEEEGDLGLGGDGGYISDRKRGSY